MQKKERTDMIAQNPPMGWNSWDCYGAAVTEETVRLNADYMAKHLKAYGRNTWWWTFNGISPRP